jgi:hypothetical protein
MTMSPVDNMADANSALTMTQSITPRARMWD